MIIFTVYGNPNAQKRHRSVRRGKFIQNYDPSDKDKTNFLLMVQENRPSKPIEGPIQLTAKFYIPRPKAHFGTGKNSGRLKESAPFYHIGKPDVDNLLKFLFDSLNGIFWKDDSQICVLGTDTGKYYSDQPRTEITIESIKDLNINF